MSGEEMGAEARTCTACGEALPEGRSVCPACGTLQPAAVAPVALGPDAGDDPIWIDPAAPLPDPDPAGSTGRPSLGRATRWMVVVTAVLVLLAAVEAVVLLTDDGGGDAAPTTTTAAAPASQGRARVAAIEGFCKDPRALDRPGIAAFEPGAGAVAIVELPQPATSTEPSSDVTIQVAPTMGAEALDLADAASLVSLAVCLEPTKTKDVEGTCTYQLTEGSSAGDRRTARLRQTTYAVRLLELRTGKVLTDGKLETATDRCPERAYVAERAGVANALDPRQIMAWVATNVPTA